MDRLSMSLDDIITKKQTSNHKKSNQHQHKNNHQHRGGQHQKGIVKSSQHQSGKKFSAPSNNNRRQFNDNTHRGGGFQRQFVVRAEEESEAPPRPFKVVTVQRPKIVQAAPGTAAATSSVFARLGQTGVAVVFANLAVSVEEADVRELARAVGEVKDAHFHVDILRGHRIARVLFASENDAKQAVAKYNGVPLDGQIMTVTIDASSQEPKSVFDRLQTSITATGKRGGLFGAALQGIHDVVVEEDDEEEDGEIEVEEGDEEEQDEEEEEEGGFTRRIIVNSYDNRGGGRGGGRGDNGRRFNRGGRGGGRGGGKPRGGFRKNNNNNNRKDIDLDADLDDYFNK